MKIYDGIHARLASLASVFRRPRAAVSACASCDTAKAFLAGGHRAFSVGMSVSMESISAHIRKLPELGDILSSQMIRSGLAGAYIGRMSMLRLPEMRSGRSAADEVQRVRSRGRPTCTRSSAKLLDETDDPKCENTPADANEKIHKNALGRHRAHPVAWRTRTQTNATTPHPADAPTNPPTMPIATSLCAVIQRSTRPKIVPSVARRARLPLAIIERLRIYRNRCEDCAEHSRKHAALKIPISTRRP